jgi:hypothetical protein
VRTNYVPSYVRADSTPSDFGVGLLHFVPGDRVDSIWLLNAPDSAGEPNGLFVLDTATPAMLRYAVIAPDSLIPNLVEYGYEILGLPIDTIRADRWVRAILGFQQTGEPHKGWVRPDTVGVSLIQWADYLPKQGLVFFRAGQPGTLFTNPGDQLPALTVALEPPLDYTLEPLEVAGRWMRARVRHPFRWCVDFNRDSVPTVELWLEYLDSRGRPAVYYPSRGC